MRIPCFRIWNIFSYWILVIIILGIMNSFHLHHFLVCLHSIKHLLFILFCRFIVWQLSSIYLKWNDTSKRYYINIWEIKNVLLKKKEEKLRKKFVYFVFCSLVFLFRILFTFFLLLNKTQAKIVCCMGKKLYNEDLN